MSKYKVGDSLIGRTSGRKYFVLAITCAMYCVKTEHTKTIHWMPEDAFAGLAPETKPSTVDWGKPVSCRDKAVRILATDAPGVYPVVGVFPCGTLGTRRADGTKGSLPPFVNVPEKPKVPETLTREVLLYRTKRGNINFTVINEGSQPMTASAQKRVLGRKTITITEGEGM